MPSNDRHVIKIEKSMIEYGRSAEKGEAKEGARSALRGPMSDRFHYVKGLTAGGVSVAQRLTYKIASINSTRGKIIITAPLTCRLRESHGLQDYLKRRLRMVVSIEELNQKAKMVAAVVGPAHNASERLLEGSE